MSDEEKLQEYLRQNASNEKKVEVADAEVPKPARSKSIKTPTEWYRGKVWGEFRIIMIIAIFIPAVVLGVLNNDWGLELDRAWTIGFVIVGAELAFMLALSIYKLVRYSRWMKGAYYKMSGWQEFFDNRTKKFWEQRNYTNVQINFRLAPDATNLHREVLKAFTSKIIRKWKNQYQDKDLEWTGSAPKDLQSNGSSISGDVSQRELLWILRILNPKFFEVSKLLGSHLSDVVIKSNSKEVNHQMKEEKEDVHDRHTSWVTRHENN